jgi:hypothetical protein
VTRAAAYDVRILPQTSARPRPHLLELVGPPGAGKTAVLQALIARGDRIARKPGLRKLEYAGVVTRATAVAAGTVARRRAIGHTLALGHVLVMAYVEALPRVVTSGQLSRAKIVAFDQGPIYFVCRPSLQSERLEPWRESVFDTWASLLDLVVWLDAPDKILTERINSRSEWHRLKGEKHETTHRALERNRRVYEAAIARLTTQTPGPTVLRFDTERRAAGAIADVVLAALPKLAKPSDDRPSSE